MPLDLLIVEDEQRIIPNLMDLVKLYGFNPLIFTNSRDCIAYLEQAKAENIELPVAYLVDMKLKDDLEGSEALYWFMKTNFPGQMDRFYFVSGHKSNHDEQVLERTGAKFYYKEDMVELIVLIKKNYTSQ